MKKIKAGEVKILGEWDGELIWRWKTSQDKLLEALAKCKKPFPIKIKI
jgi:hypothetical protein